MSAGVGYCLMLSNQALCTLLSPNAAGKVSASILRCTHEDFSKGCSDLGSHFSSAVGIILI